MKILFYALLACVGLYGCSGKPSDLVGDKADSEKVSWHLSTWGNPRAVTTAIEAVANYVHTESDGQFEIKVHFGESVSPARQNLDSLSIRLVDAAQTCSSYHPGKTPAMTALELPFLPINDLDQTIAVHTAFFNHSVVQDELAAWNAQLLFLVPTPQPEFIGRGDAPIALENWKGMRVRATGGLGHAMIELGASPISAPPPEVYIGLERNLFQGAAFPYTYAFGAYRLFEVSSWYTTNMRPAGFNCPVLVNKSSYDSLPEEYKVLLADAIEHAYSAQKQAFDEADKKWLAIFEAEGLTPITYEPEQLAKFQEIAAKPVWDRWVERMSEYDIDGTQLLVDVQAMAAAQSKD